MIHKERDQNYVPVSCKVNQINERVNEKEVCVSVLKMILKQLISKKKLLEVAIKISEME
jgi:hypothetical protein